MKVGPICQSEKGGSRRLTYGAALLVIVREGGDEMFFSENVKMYTNFVNV